MPKPRASAAGATAATGAAGEEGAAAGAAGGPPPPRVVLADDFPWQGPVTEIPADATIADALATLTKHGLLSAPVYDARKHKYLGMFDIADVLALVYGVDLLRHLVPVSKLKEQVVDVHGLKLDLSQSRDAQGTDMPVSTMMQANGQTAPWWPVGPKSTLLDVVKRLAAKVDPPWSPCRRVPVVDPATGRVTKIVTQSEMVSQIYHNVVDHQQTEPLFIQTPRTHGHGLCSVACVAGTEPARRAFEIIINKHVSAVPVLGPEGGMVAAITNKDIALLQKMRAAAGDNVDELPALDFVQLARETAREAGIRRGEPISVSVDTPVHVIIAILGREKTHRVFLVGEKRAPPVGVVSVSDVVKLILDEALPWPTAVLVEKVAAGGAKRE